MSGSSDQERQQALVETFVLLADTLVDDFDVVELFDNLVGSSVQLLGAAAAGLLLEDRQGNLNVVASSTEQTRLLEVFALQRRQGPCFDCIRTGELIISQDLEADTPRWPQFVPAALAADYRTVMAVPLRLRAQRIGGLNIFGSEPGAISEEDCRIAQALADVATIGILQQRLQHESAYLVEQMQHALNSRVVIEQAKGVLAERAGTDVVTAFTLLRRHARDSRSKITDVAKEVVDGTLLLP